MANIGTVKWFDAKKGFGFIEQQGGDDLFVHISNVINSNNSNQLSSGDQVEFEVITTKKGPAAGQVKKTNGTTPAAQPVKSEQPQAEFTRPEPEPVPDVSFADLGLNDELIETLTKAGFENPRPVQAETIPIVLEGNDIVSTAPTGTGKTAAFLLPIFQLLEPAEQGPQALVLAPTHELADQITREAEKLNPGGRFNIESVYGGTDIYSEIDRLEKPVDLLIACPGRLLDHYGRGTVNFRSIKYFVLDEADRMCDMGFLPEIKKIMYRIPQGRQNLFFSATIPTPIQKLAERILDQPEKISVGRQAPTSTISHFIVPVKPQDKDRILKKILDHKNITSGIIFCRTRNTVRKLTRKLRNQGYNACGLQGGMDSIAREATMSGFRRQRFQFLVATNVAARGLDVDHISHVINYDVPDEPDVYTHRIGRTGRAGETGDAYTLATRRDKDDLRAIEKTIGYRIERENI